MSVLFLINLIFSNIKGDLILLVLSENKPLNDLSASHTAWLETNHTFYFLQNLLRAMWLVLCFYACDINSSSSSSVLSS